MVHVEDGRITKIVGDPDFPTNRGTLCSKGLAFHHLVYHPDTAGRHSIRDGQWVFIESSWGVSI